MKMTPLTQGQKADADWQMLVLRAEPGLFGSKPATVWLMLACLKDSLICLSFFFSVKVLTLGLAYPSLWDASALPSIPELEARCSANLIPALAILFLAFPCFLSLTVCMWYCMYAHEYRVQKPLWTVYDCFPFDLSRQGVSMSLELSSLVKLVSRLSPEILPCIYLFSDKIGNMQLHSCCLTCVLEVWAQTLIFVQQVLWT